MTGPDRQIIFRPIRIRPKVEPKDTPLRRERLAIVGDWSQHAVDMHYYADKDAEMADIAHILHECGECAQYLANIRASEAWTETTRPNYGMS